MKKPIHVYLDEETFLRLDQMTKNENRTRSNMIQYLIKEYYNNNYN